jgi:DDE superfamily endonuclease
VSADFVAAMEDVLDLYAEPYDAARPVVCFDESPEQLIAEVRQPLPPEPGQPARHDVEYRRNGVRNLLMICEPKRGWREVLVTTTRNKIDFARAMKQLVQTYADAEVIRVVLDNLTIHTRSPRCTRRFPRTRREPWRGSWNSISHRNTAVGSTSPRLNSPC